MDDETFTELQKTKVRLERIADFYYKEEEFWWEVGERGRCDLAARRADLTSGAVNRVQWMMTHAPLRKQSRTEDESLGRPEAS